MGISGHPLVGWRFQQQSDTLDIRLDTAPDPRSRPLSTRMRCRMNNVEQLEMVRLRAAVNANVEDAAVWRWFADLMEDNGSPVSAGMPAGALRWMGSRSPATPRSIPRYGPPTRWRRAMSRDENAGSRRRRPPRSAAASGRDAPRRACSSPRRGNSPRLQQRPPSRGTTHVAGRSRSRPGGGFDRPRPQTAFTTRTTTLNRTIPTVRPAIVSTRTLARTADIWVQRGFVMAIREKNANGKTAGTMGDAVGRWWA